MTNQTARPARQPECYTPRLRHSIFRMVVVPAAAGALFLSAGCGGGSSAPSSPTPPPPTPRLLQQGNFSLAAPDGNSAYFAAINISDPATGLWEATVDWALTENTHWMWVSNGACTPEQFTLPECPFDANCPCQFAVRSQVATPKPRILSIPNAAAGTHTLIVVDLGPREDDFTYRVTLTPSSLVAGSATGATATGAVLRGRKVMSR